MGGAEAAPAGQRSGSGGGKRSASSASGGPSTSCNGGSVVVVRLLAMRRPRPSQSHWQRSLWNSYTARGQPNSEYGKYIKILQLIKRLKDIKTRKLNVFKMGVLEGMGGWGLGKGLDMGRDLGMQSMA